MQEELSNFINSLRKLKFGKVILKKLITKFGRRDFKLIVLDTEDESNGVRVSFTLLVRVAQDLNEEELVRWLSAQVTLKPLSKFGLSPTIRVIHDKEITEYAKRTDYAVYLEGKFYDKVRDIDVDTVLRTDDYKFPPMISDIHVSREIIAKSSLPYR